MEQQAGTDSWISSGGLRCAESQARVGAQTLGFVRAWVFGIWLCKVATAPFFLLAELPVSIFEPPVFMRMAPTEAWTWLLRPDVLTGFQILLCTCVALTALGLRPYRPIAATTSILLTFHQGLIRSFGHINHPEIPLLLATYVLAMFSAADGFTWRTRRQALQPSSLYVAPILLIAALLLLTYTAAAAYRMAHHGLATLAGEPLMWTIAQHSLADEHSLIVIFIHHHSIVAQLLRCSVPIVTVFEWTAPLALVSRRFRWLWLGFVFMFHIVTWLVIDVFFWESLLLAIVILPALDRVTATLPP